MALRRPDGPHCYSEMLRLYVTQPSSSTFVATSYSLQTGSKAASDQQAVFGIHVTAQKHDPFGHTTALIRGGIIHPNDGYAPAGWTLIARFMAFYRTAPWCPFS